MSACTFEIEIMQNVHHTANAS